MNGSYVYRPLHVAADEFRILQIEPSTDDKAPLRCSINYASLATPPPFTGLSYTWTDPLDLGEYDVFLPITIDGIRFTIRRSLFQALEYLRFRKVEHVWVDALCINQNDIDERGAQVLRMRTIYGRAENVIAWLGPATEDSHIACEFVKLLAQTAQGENSTEWLETSLSQSLHSSGWHAFANLLKRKWWTRAWVIQEIVQSANADFAAGRHGFTAREIERACDGVSNGWNVVYPLLLGKENIILPRESFDAVNGMSLLSKAQRSNIEVGLLSCLARARSTKATDDRDCLYAKLGLAYDAVDVVSAPNYLLSATEIYATLVRTYVLQTQSLDIICQCFDRSPHWPWPSWVSNLKATDGPNPVQPSLQKPVQRGTRMEFKAAGSTDAQVQFMDDDLTIKAIGTCVDVIDSVGHNINKAAYGSSPPSTETAYGTAGTFEAIWRTLIADQDRVPNPIEKAPAGFGVAFAQLCQELNEKYADTEPEAELQGKSPSDLFFENWYRASRQMHFAGKTLEEWAASGEPGPASKDTDYHKYAFQRSFHDINYKRRMVQGKNGYIGTGPLAAKPGDLICVLEGCSTPVVLRWKDHRHELLGEGYFHGIMHGEALELVEKGKLKWVEFEIR